MRQIITLLLLVTSSLFCSEFETVFQQGNEFYKTGAYTKALSFYQLLEEKGLSDPALFYNMGNSYAQEKSYGYAILYYEKALAIDPDLSDATINLNLIKRKNIDRVLDLSGKVETVGIHAIYPFLRRLNTTLLISFFLLLWIIFWGILIGKKFRIQHFKRNIYTFSLFLLALLILFNSILLTGHYYASKMIRLGVAVTPEVAILEGPDQQYHTRFTIHEGLKVNITDERDQWYEITLPNGNVGWASKSDLKEI